jgi:hypothetical protein
MAKKQIRNYVFSPGPSGVGYVKVLDKIQLNQVLLISNVTDNVVLYNFADPANKINVVFSDAESDTDFPYANTASNGVTTIIFQFDTSDQSSTDSIQIFIEDEEVRFRPYNFGTDAIERMRVATPQSMLDADFEYGLQPTKWQTIDLMRGYPSIYEVPGSDLQVTDITTDASSPFGGFGDSLISVTTSEAHGYTAGTPVRILGVLDTVTGASRAEGTFVVFDAPTTTSFRYYAKGKVGSTNGQSLLTSYITLRKGGFYTGSAIGSPSFTIQSQGSNGTFTSRFNTRVGSTRISTVGVATAVIGSFLTATGITTGAQVTGISAFSTSRTLALDVTAPSYSLTVNGNTNNIEVGSALDDGTGTSTFVTNITDNTLTLSDPIQVNLIGSSDEIGIRTAIPYNFGNGSGASFRVERNNGRYSAAISAVSKTSVTGSSGTSYINVGNISGIVEGQTATGTGVAVGATVIGYVGIATAVLSLNNTGTVSGTVVFTKPGIGYSTTDRIIIPGNILGGSTPEHDLIVKVDSVNGVGGITSVKSSKYVTGGGEAQLSAAQFKTGGTSLLLNPLTGSTDYINVASDPDFNFGTGSFTIDFWIYRNRTSATEFLFDMRTTDPELSPVLQLNSSNQLLYYVNGSAVITSTSTIPGSTWTHIALSRNVVTGIAATSETRMYINGTQEGSTYLDNNNYGQRPVRIGANYQGNFGFYGHIDDFRLTKGISRYVSNFTPSSFFVPNDTYNVLLLRFNGDAASTAFADDSKGTAVTSSRFYFLSGVTSGGGFGAQFSIQRIGGASPSYNVTIATPGQNYNNSDTITFDGSLLGGSSVVNDLTLTVTSVSGGGEILTFTQSGTASNGNDIYQAISGSNSGTNSTFTIGKSGSQYTALVGAAGSGYYPGYQLRLAGNNLGGTTPTNDLIITVGEVDRDGPGVDPANIVLGRIVSVGNTGTPVVGSSVNFYPSVSISEPVNTIINNTSTVTFSSLARILVTFAANHGLVPGNTALVSITSSGTGHNIAAGPRIIDDVPALNQLVYTARSPGSISPAGIVGQIYPRPDCFYIHRPFDGGVQLGTGGPAHAAHAIRQSKKYLRYQSGKGIMYTTGTLFAPSHDLRSVTATGTAPGSVITVVTDGISHGLQVGAEIALNDITTSGYDNHYIVSSIIDEETFTVLSIETLGSTNAVLGTQAQVALYKWKGATVRAGAFDDQNGIFWQYDGVNLAVGLRSATYQLAGTIAINSDSNAVTGTNTRFQDQLKVGDRIVIRGMTHVVTNVLNQNSMTVTPDFRGVSNISGAKAALVNEVIIPQYQWNIDRADGTGPSGYEIKVNKMQMIGFQYTWYGAGFIDWMLRGPNGDYLFVHRLKNNNRNTEAFMRSGNLPVRYEVINEGAKTKLTQSVGIGSTVLYVDDTTLLPHSGSLYIDNEIINYTGIGTTTNSLTGLTRAATFSNFYSGSQRSYTAGAASTHSSGTGIVLLSNTATPIISHWGSAFLTDGLFDQDRGYIFNYQSVNFPVSTIKNTAFLIRLAPSVSNAIIGDLGQRELINRAQLLLQGIEFTPTGGSSATSVVIEGILNPQNYPTNPADITWFGLSNAGAGGQPSFAQIANGNSVNWIGAVSPVTASNAITQNSRTQYVVFNRAATANVRTGMSISGTGVPGGTTVIGFFSRDATTWFIQFSQAVIPGAAGATSYTFNSPVFALPGETIFSFVGDGTQKSSLDLSSLKELNNTPIGGRGTFPNGPDVLAINVYTTGGAAFTGTVALRWGEAQA